MGTSMSGSRSSASSQNRTPASNAIRKAVTNAKSAVKVGSSIAPVEGGGKK